MFVSLTSYAVAPVAEARTSHRHALSGVASRSVAQRAFTCRRTQAHGGKKATSSRGIKIVCLAEKATEAAEQVDSRLSIDLSADELASSVEFGKSPDGLFIVVARVAPNSAAEQEGVKVGQKLLAVSTPMPSGSGGELLNVTERSSLRFVKDAIRMNRSGNVSIVLSRLPINMSPEESEGAISSFLESVAGSDDEDSSPTIAEKLAKVYKEEEETAYRERTQRQRRIQRRKDYMERESTRDNTKFFIGLAASLFLPAIGILAYAFSSGLLDSISSGYRPY